MFSRRSLAAPFVSLAALFLISFLIVAGFGSSWSGSGFSAGAYFPPTDGVPSATPASLLANVSISGRVINRNGIALRGITVRATNNSTGTVVTAATSSFGIYRFENLYAPETYTILPVAKRYRFGARIITVTGDTTNIDFIDENDPVPAVNAGIDQVVPLPNVIRLNGLVIGGVAPLSVTWSAVSGPGPVSFSNANAAVTNATVNLVGIYILRLSVTDAGFLSASDEVQIIVTAAEGPPPPDPASIAPPIRPTTATNPYNSTKFLYSGPNPIQTGVAPDTIKPERVGVIRGRVLDRANQPVPNVNITILDRPELGQTRSQADGMFDMVINAGGDITIRYEKQGFIPLQREEKIDWQTYDTFEDVVMTPYDPNVTTINLASQTPIQVASGSMSADSSGQRRSRLFFKQGTQVTFRLPNGSTQQPSTINVRSTEFTSGATGRDAMPGDLPPTSEYTYAAEYSVDEAVESNATDVTFDRPVIQYLENFIGFPTGAEVPTGSYNRTTAEWEAEPSGRVVKIISVSSGTANLDVTGNGNPATDAEYAALGFNLAERQKLAELYPVNQTLWRVPLNHFSPWDCNYPPADKPPPDAPPPFAEPKPTPCEEEDGCNVEIQSQTLKETIPFTQTGYQMSYQTGLQKDYQQNSVVIPLVGPFPDPDMIAAGATIDIAGRHITTDQITPSSNLTASFTWDGLDDFGRAVQGGQTAHIAVVNFYPLRYALGSEFGQTGNGGGQTVAGSGRSSTFRTYEVQLGGFDRGKTGLGGWSFDIHHDYNTTTRELIEGNGKRRRADGLVKSVVTAAGVGDEGFAGDGAPATGARLAGPSDVAFAADGSYYIADTLNHRVRRVSSDGAISTVAGNGSECAPTAVCGDGGAATGAQLFEPRGVAVSAGGEIYISDSGSNRIRKIGTDGVITTIAGSGAECSPMQPCGDGLAAPQASFNRPGKIHLAQDGSLYIADTGSNRVRKLSTNGIVRTIAGSGAEACPSNNVPTLNACIESPTGVALTQNGELYITANAPQHSQVVRLAPDGLVHQIADGICNGARPEEARPEGLRSICNPLGVMIGPEGSPYVASSGEHRIYKYDTDSMWKEVVGSGSNFYNGEGQPSLSANLDKPAAVAMAPNGDLLIAAAGDNRVRRAASPLPGFTNEDSLVASEDGTEVFEFNGEGQHRRTLNALTGTTKYAFAYDANGNLNTITDGDGNVTTVERDGSGKPTGIRSPYGQLTTLSLDSNGYLTSVTNPAGETQSYTYSSGGLMLTKRDARNNLNTFTYNATGRLIRNDNPTASATTLARAGGPLDYTVTHKSPLNRTSTFRIQNAPNRQETQDITFRNGSKYKLTTQPDGSTSAIDADGTSGQNTLGPDPRWAMQAPLELSMNIATPGGRSLNFTQARTVALADPANPFSLTEQHETPGVNGRNFLIDYTASNRTFVFRSPENRTVTSVIDSQERLTRIQSPGINMFNLTYDSRGRQSTLSFGTGGDARTFANTYNVAGFVSQRTDPLNRTTAFQYDPVGRMTQKTLVDSRVIGFGYDAAGNLTSVTPPGRPAHTLGYNNRNLVSSYTAPNLGGSSTTTYEYNLDRDPTRVTRPDALQINSTYNALGQLQTKTTPTGNYGYTYSKTGQLTGVTAPGGIANSFQYDGSLLTQATVAGPVPASISFTYNNDFLVSAASVNGSTPIDYTYDNDNLMIGAGGMTLSRNTQNVLLTGSTLGNVTDTITYNSFGEPSVYDAKFNSTSIYNIQNTYDKLGRITRKVEAVGGVTTTYDYGYDSTNRLTTVALNGAPQPMVTYAYDSNDNRTSVNLSGIITNATYDAQDRLTSYGSATYAYTSNGELRSKTVASSITTYNYDVLGNLRSVTLPAGTKIEYLADGLDRRVGKRVNGALMQGFLYQDDLQVAAELDGSGNVLSRFVYATRSNVPDFMLKNGQIYRLILDNVGSVRLVVDVSTGNIAQRIDYDEFGVVLNDTSPGFQPFGFAGGLYDSQTKLTRFGARDYDPEAGRWTAKDPHLFAGGDTNLYSYVFADPINITDPSGLAPAGKAAPAKLCRRPSKSSPGPGQSVGPTMAEMEKMQAEMNQLDIESDPLRNNPNPFSREDETYNRGKPVLDPDFLRKTGYKPPPECPCFPYRQRMEEILGPKR